MEICVVSLFPETIQQVLNVGIPRKAIANGQLAVRVYNPRDYTTDTHRTVDDRPFGGGPGMVMKVEPLRAALRAARDSVAGRRPGEDTDSGTTAGNSDSARVIYLSPQGARFDQQRARQMATRGTPLVLLAGRYEGIDERIVESDVDEELSIGDFILSGGEIAALTIIDAVARLLPGVLGHPESALQDSFAHSGLLDHPHYTRPEVLDGVGAPSVLLSGDHRKIADWRRRQALTRTWQRRPELLDGAQLSAEDQAFLSSLGEAATASTEQDRSAQKRSEQ